MMATGTAMRGMMADRQFWRNSRIDDGDEDDGVSEGLEDLIDGFVDEWGGVVDDGVVETGGEPVSEILHFFTDEGGGVEGVGAGELVDGEGDGGAAVEGAGLVVGLGARARCWRRRACG